MTRFTLPVMGATGVTGADDLVRLSLRAEGVFDATLGEGLNLEFGLAIVSEEFADISDGNQVRDVALAPGHENAGVIGEVDALFSERGRRCQRWTFADGRTPAWLRAALEMQGYSVRSETLWHSVKPPVLTERKDVMIIPGRASFEKLADLFEGRHGAKPESVRMQIRGVTGRRLDDTRVDNLLALVGTTPVGALYFVVMGEVGLITQFFVHSDYQRQGVGSTLISRALELAARSRVRHVTLFCEEGNGAAEGLYRKAGFTGVTTVDAMVIGR